eukprot:15169044-Heterocapsa_arctica.AAC.1
MVQGLLGARAAPVGPEVLVGAHPGVRGPRRAGRPLLQDTRLPPRLRFRKLTVVNSRADRPQAGD